LPLVLVMVCPEGVGGILILIVTLVLSVSIALLKKVIVDEEMLQTKCFNL